LRFGGLRHCVCFPINPIAKERIVAPRLLQQLYHLGCLLLIDDGEFERELLAQFGELIVAALRRQNQDNEI
jgi:hypothetical protein